MRDNRQFEFHVPPIAELVRPDDAGCHAIRVLPDDVLVRPFDDQTFYRLKGEN